MDKDQNLNLKIENKEVAQFTGMARAQMFFETVMSFLRMLLSLLELCLLVLDGLLGISTRTILNLKFLPQKHPKTSLWLLSKNNLLI